jgi:hypothetical protein
MVVEADVGFAAHNEEPQINRKTTVKLPLVNA